MDVALFDYGVGNMHSLAKALQAGGAAVHTMADPTQAVQADALVLPGVGAFGAAAARLAPGLPALRGAIASGLPCLGICLGMQLLFEESEEGPGTGLAVIPGRVRRLRTGRIPHIGWNRVEVDPDEAIFNGLTPLTVYYANSYVCEPEKVSDIIGWTEYGDERFPAAVRRDNVWGFQFHPEKSGEAGLNVIHRFLEEAVR